MLVVCSIVIAVSVGGVNVFSKTDVEGKLLKENDSKYLVDFSEGVKKFNAVGDPNAYAKFLVNKDDCIKE